MREKEIKEKPVKPAKQKTKHTGTFKFFQHILITVATVSLLFVVTGSTVMIPTYSSTSRYKLSASDSGRTYEESVLFNSILGNEINSLLKLITIRTQFETNGVYDLNKVIDITAYNNRHNVSSNNSPITAKYYLGDLLKWSRYGFSYELLTQSVMDEDANALASNSLDGTGSIETYNDSSNTYSMLINRYKTVDSKPLEGCASNWGEYNYLLEELITAADDLKVNYDEYLKMSEYFSDKSSNIRYCVTIGSSKNKEVYTNDNLATSDKATLTEHFKKYGKYIIFDAYNMQYSTNTAITESTFNMLFTKYDYAFSDDCTIYIAVDNEMPVSDGFKIAKKGFNNYLPYYKPLYISIALCVILYLVLLVVCTIREGNSINEAGIKFIRLTDFDNTSIESWIVISLIIVIAIPLLAATIVFQYFEELRDLFHEPYFIVILGICTFIYDLVVLNLYYSLVRRIKGKNIWRPSLLRKFVLFCKKSIGNIYDNGNLIIRSIVPIIIFFICNLLCIIGMFCHKPIIKAAAFIILLLVDITCAVIVYTFSKQRADIITGMKKIILGDLNYKPDTSTMYGDNKELAMCVNSISESVRNAVDQSTKDERMKTDLIANVSHDIRTPLTSIINYVDLIKRENIDDDKVMGYVDIIDQKSQRLKTLVDDLIEASKASSGNIELNMQNVNLSELLDQSIAEFEDKFAERGLSYVISNNGLNNPILKADSQSLWRVIENLFGNACKYSMPNTRIFIDIFNINNDQSIVLQIKNMSEKPLPDSLSELTERFIRGDVSRTTEGNGLGLSIAKSLTELMDGQFILSSDADLFKVEICFDTVKES